MKFDRYIIAYDISSDKRRNKLSRLLQGWGERVNLSVFECEIKKGKFDELRKKILKIINNNEDLVIYYPLCLNCLSRIKSDGIQIQRKMDNILLTV